ncbi:MAG: hypothetical protein P4N60_00440 [Verrucomicrobiae bacterium]|nr:hypothetical protein [Verrucomicrobiae bacterium]
MSIEELRQDLNDTADVALAADHAARCNLEAIVRILDEEFPEKEIRAKYETTRREIWDQTLIGYEDKDPEKAARLEQHRPYFPSEH